MADDKRNRGDQQPGGNQRTERQRNRDRQPGSGGGAMETPRSTGTRREEDEEQE